jgi:hypothetical protein
MKKLAIVAGLALSLAVAGFSPALAQEEQEEQEEPPLGEPPTLVPGPATSMWGYIPCCGIFAPLCMYTDRLLFNCTGTMTGGSVWGEEGISGILASCVGYGATGVWDWLGPWFLYGPCAPCINLCINLPCDVMVELSNFIPFAPGTGGEGGGSHVAPQHPPKGGGSPPGGGGHGGGGHGGGG